MAPPATQAVPTSRIDGTTQLSASCVRIADRNIAASSATAPATDTHRPTQRPTANALAHTRIDGAAVMWPLGTSTAAATAATLVAPGGCWR
jgi:hypothetical protein